MTVPGRAGGPVGVLGAGRMGDPVAARLAAAGTEVWFHDPRPDAGAAALRAGARRAATVAELAALPVSLSLLPDPATSLAALAGEHGLLRRARPDHVHLHMGTVDPGTVRRLAGVGPVVVDCPVSGSVDHARRGELTAVVGCAEDVLDVATAVLRPFTAHRIRVGGVGAASTTKLAVNSVTGVYAAALAEALAFCVATGVDAEAAYDVFEHSVMATPFLSYKRAHVFRPALPPDGPIAMVLKDLDLATAVAGSTGSALACADAARALLGRAVAAGAGGADVGALFSLLRDAHRARP